LTENKVKIEIKTITLQVIQKAKEKLAEIPEFNFVRYLSVDDFLDFFFGLSEVAQFCRASFFKTIFSEISKEMNLTTEKTTSPQPSDQGLTSSPELTSGTEEKKTVETLGTISGRQQKLIDKLKEKGKLTKRQICEMTKLGDREVSWDLETLLKKGIIVHVPSTFEYELVPGMAEKFKVEIPLSDRITDLLKMSGEALTSSEIAKKVDEKKATVLASLHRLEGKGTVEPIQAGNQLKWLLTKKQETTMTTEIKEEEPTEKFEISERQQKVIDKLKEKGPMSKAQLIAEIEGNVDWDIRYLLDKGIIKRRPDTFLYELVPEMVEKLKLRGPSLGTRIKDKLRISNDPLPTTDIADKVGSDRRTVNETLHALEKRGEVEKVPIRPNLTAWKLSQQKPE